MAKTKYFAYNEYEDLILSEGEIQCCGVNVLEEFPCPLSEEELAPQKEYCKMYNTSLKEEGFYPKSVLIERIREHLSHVNAFIYVHLMDSQLKEWQGTLRSLGFKKIGRAYNRNSGNMITSFMYTNKNNTRRNGMR